MGTELIQKKPIGAQKQLVLSSYSRNTRPLIRARTPPPPSTGDHDDETQEVPAAADSAANAGNISATSRSPNVRLKYLIDLKNLPREEFNMRCEDCKRSETYIGMYETECQKWGCCRDPSEKKRGKCKNCSRDFKSK